MNQKNCIKLNNVKCEQDECNATSPYRTYSGCCNNLADKTLGQANSGFLRLMVNEYENKKDLPRGGLNPSRLPSPRDISAKVHRVKETKENSIVSLMVMQFGQFLDHDITLTPEQGTFTRQDCIIGAEKSTC